MYANRILTPFLDLYISFLYTNTISLYYEFPFNIILYRYLPIHKTTIILMRFSNLLYIIMYGVRYITAEHRAVLKQSIRRRFMSVKIIKWGNKNGKGGKKINCCLRTIITHVSEVLVEN